MSVYVYLVLFFYLHVVLSQGTGSGTNGNLRLCIVGERGSYKRAPHYCPVLDKEKSGVECVLGTDRLDCLRRISKGTVDFGVFSPEDLMAAEWSKIDVLVTDEIRLRKRPFARNIVAVVNKRILPDTSSTLNAVLRNTTLCHPGESMEDIRPLSETLSSYLETLVLERSCDPALSNTENKLKALADFYGNACKAGPWVPDAARDAELKRKYPSLCAACSSTRCSVRDRYWGTVGSLTCLTDGVGDVTWGDADDITSYFKLKPGVAGSGSQNFAYLCRDGTWREMTDVPCVWLRRPWNVIVAKRKAADAITRLVESLTNSSVTTDQNWRSALAALLESNQGLPEPLQPPKTALDYLTKADGFREAYSQTGCSQPRHIVLCTTSLLARNKCEWLSEAAGVYGIQPSVQCAVRNSTEECLTAIAAGEIDVVVGNNDDLVTASRLNITAILHEIAPSIDETNTVVAYVNSDAKITKMADLRGKRAAFPRYDGATWHSVLRYFTENEKITCRKFMDDYFSEICAPGMDGKKCYEAGEEEALKSLLEGKSDVAFISKETFNRMKNNTEMKEREKYNKIVSVCPENNQKYCYISWSNLGHIFAAKNITDVRRHEIVNVFTKMDRIFGKEPPFHNPMFLMYGSYNHEIEVVFNSKTKLLGTDTVLKNNPYNKLPNNFELSITDFTCSFGGKIMPSFAILVVSLVVLIFK